MYASRLRAPSAQIRWSCGLGSSSSASARLGSRPSLHCFRSALLTAQIESFLHLYAHITSPAELAPVTDILCFASRIQRPGIWEEMVK